MSKFKIWSCKLNRPDTLKSHRTLEAASKRVGDYGLVYDPSVDAVYQVFNMSNGSIGLFDTVKQADRCAIGGFDMRLAMQSINVLMPNKDEAESQA